MAHRRVAYSPEEQNLDAILPPVPVVGDATADRLIRQARRIVISATLEAERNHSFYFVLRTDGTADQASLVEIRQNADNHTPVIVTVASDSCTCTIFRETIAPLRQKLLDTGLTLKDLVAGFAWPHCKHPAIVAHLSVNFPARFTDAKRFEIRGNV